MEEIDMTPQTRKQAERRSQTGNASLQPSRSLLSELEAEQNDVKRSVALLLVGIILIAANLRTPLTSVSPLLDLIRLDIPISGTLAGFLTTLPLLAFAGLSPFVPKLARQFGIEHTLFAALIVLLAGSLIRQGGNEASLLLGTVVTGLGIAVGNVMLPALIKKEFPHRLGIMTGVYSISMNVFAAMASAVSVPIARSTSLAWRGTLLTITLIALVSILFWLPQLRHNAKPGKNKAAAVQVSAARTGNGDSARPVSSSGTATAAPASAKPALGAGGSRNPRSVWRSGLAWNITLYMGLQSLIFYVFVAWLPDMLLSQGLSHEQSGFMLSLLQIGLIPFTFIIPIIAARRSSQLGLMVGTGCFYFLGFAGILLSHGNMGILSLSVLLLGVAGGTSFSLAMMFFSLRARTAQEASEISGMAQSIGYLLAATGPFLFGAIHDAANSWNMPMLLLFAAAAVLILVGIAPSKGKSYVFPE
ncbi:hypothetical protein AWM70_14630 [Paenibacillus yonginensis]|uniref:Major facilitator superfamily (MFS) profile domain-containing protein n=1 Tax=Paenibacillus yonginensis TaxID=1462996 RepID=A0A1B1N2N0_9BACL|nr:MFS transporter [Paenibacillus yonginensis]ANS75678.1 hypothetical protein AWM70_14630 [Paenibacillus yonginensis]